MSVTYETVDGPTDSGTGYTADVTTTTDQVLVEGSCATFRHVVKYDKHSNWGQVKEVAFDDYGVGGFNVSLDFTYEDHEDAKWLDLDIPREAMVEIHRWLSERLYGES